MLLHVGAGCANTHLFTGEQQGSRSHQLEAVGSHRRGGQEPVHDVHRQAAALEGQAQILVQRDEPADQRAASLRSQLQAETGALIFFVFFFLLILNMGHTDQAESSTCGCRAKLLHG